MNLSPGQYPNYPTGSDDNTHLQEEGARRVAALTLWALSVAGSPLITLLPEAPERPAS